MHVYHLFAVSVQAPDMYSGQVREALLQSATGFIIAILFFAVGIASIVVYRLRKRRDDAALLWFGLFLTLYAARNSDFLRIVRFLAHLNSPAVWDYFSAVIHHLLVFPFLLFLYEIFPAWRRALRWVIWSQVPLALINFAADIILHRPNAFFRFNSGLAVVIFLGFVVAAFTQGGKTLSARGLRAGILIFTVSMVAANLNGAHVISLPFNPEPLGFVILVITMGTLITSRAVESQRRLIELDRELDIAREIQASILPRELPQTDRLRMAVRYLPMKAVAGDFYDLLLVDERHIGIMIADVSGHGVPAALIASMFKVATAAQLPHAADPAMVLAGINQALCGKLRAQFVTAAYLYLDFDNLILRYAAAGHPPIFFEQAVNHSLVSIEENGLPLGLISVATYSFTERPLTGGSRFLLYTDGLLEASNSGHEFFGTERIQTALARSAGLDADEAADAVLNSVKQWVGLKEFSQQQDDITLMVVDVS